MATSNQEKRTKKMNSGGLYIALAVCILSVVCVGVYGAVLGLVKPMTENSESNQSDSTLPRVTIVEPSNDAQKDQRQNVPPTSAAPANKPANDPEQSVNATPVSPEYVLPLVGSVIKEFSDDLLVYSETMNDYRVHNGVDLAAVVGERVKAMGDGVVERVYDDPLMGQTVVLDHGNGLKTVYQGLMPNVPDGIEEGATVNAGDVIGGVGDTALIECAQEPHLHFEVWRDDTPVNPREFFE